MVPLFVLLSMILPSGASETLAFGDLEIGRAPGKQPGTLPIELRPRESPGNAQRLRSPRPQRHASPGERIGEFFLNADRALDNSDGSRSRLPLPFVIDQRSVGRIDFANFATLATPGTRCLCHSARRGRRFSRGALQRAIRRPNSFLKIFFCRRQAQDLRKIRRPPNLTSGEARQHSQYVLKCAAADSRSPK